ncbi:putative glucuronosyltransferase [Canna indica]|uniref:Glycosyltransferases n=1 Tax=Canna indica TaxID=4628 RepID=A0AAQ3Q5T6_9LILI|nr:putative glucuronosyltransferase [Canna indica]
MGAISVGILTHTRRSDAMGDPEVGEEEKEEKSPMPIQGPTCNSSGHLVGWHTYNPLPNKGAAFIGAGRTVLPMKMEWAGFVLNSRMLWREVEDKPNWDSILTNQTQDETEYRILFLANQTRYNYYPRTPGVLSLSLFGVL